MWIEILPNPVTPNPSKILPKNDACKQDPVTFLYQCATWSPQYPFSFKGFTFMNSKYACHVNKLSWIEYGQSTKM